MDSPANSKESKHRDINLVTTIVVDLANYPNNAFTPGHSGVDTTDTRTRAKCYSSIGRPRGQLGCVCEKSKILI